MSRDEDYEKDLTEEFDKALTKDVTLTKAQIGNVRLRAKDEDLWERIRNNIKNIRRRRRRK